MIDEKKLIEEIADFKRCQKSKNCDYLTGYISALSAVEGMIAELPKVGEWIPVSERLPEVGSQVIVSTREGVVYGDIDYGYPWSGSNPKYLCFYKWDDEMWQCFRPDVIAWMPLPEPYKGGE